MILFHVLNRGVDKRTVFMDKKDYFRFIHNLFEFNDINKTLHNGYYFSQSQSVDIGCQQIDVGRTGRKLLVQLHAFCLMPNHYHLLVSPLVEDGVPLFMKKLNGGYAKYFNEKYDRKGALWQGKYKKVEIKSDRQFSWIPYYIHFNPLDLVMPQWRERGIKNPKKAEAYLKTYRWSSHLDYLGIKNFPSLTQREYYLEFFEGENLPAPSVARQAGGYADSIPDMLRSFSVEEGGENIALE